MVAVNDVAVGFDLASDETDNVVRRQQSPLVVNLQSYFPWRFKQSRWLVVLAPAKLIGSLHHTVASSQSRSAVYSFRAEILTDSR